MAGYTPLFSSMLEGSLYGRWPYNGVWGCVLAMAGARGEIDKTPQVIAAMIGIPVKQLEKCIEDFMSPDTASRSPALEGRRLVLIDEARNWGWRVFNIQKYRDKAATQNQIADGRNAEKLRRYRAKKKEAKAPDTGRHRATPGDTGRHPATPLGQDTNSDSDSDSELTNHPHPKILRTTGEKSAAQPDFVSGWAFAKWLKYCKAEGRPVPAHSLESLRQKFGRLGDHAAQVAAVEHSIANGYKGLFAAPKGNNGQTKHAPTVAELEARERR